MWLLESSGSTLSKKRIWLRPGCRHHLGRTKPAANDTVADQKHYVEHKSVSRKHLAIEVEPVPEQIWLDPHSRSTATITDFSKTGTVLDRIHKFAGQSRPLPNALHSFQLGTCDETFTLRWLPVTFTCVSTRQSQPDPAEEVRRALGPLDIRLLPAYEPRQVTHVLVNKRNTSTGLQALVDGAHLVLDSFVGEIERAAAPAERHGLLKPSGLDTDFDAHWPDPLPHLPPPGKEPVPRPAEVFRPDPARQTVFRGLLFLFLDQGQFDSLRGTVTMAAGRAVFLSIVPGQTSAETVLQFIQSQCPQADVSSGKYLEGVVVIKPRQDGPYFTTLQQQVERGLRKPYTLQNELLDLILTADTSKIRQLGPPASAQEQSQELDLDGQDNDETVIDGVPIKQEPAAHVKSEPVSQSSTHSRPSRRGVPVRRFRGFDDSDDDDIPMSHPEPESDLVVPKTEPVSPTGSLPQPDQSQRRSQPVRRSKRPFDDSDSDNDLSPKAGPRVTPASELPPGPPSLPERNPPPPASPRPNKRKLSVVAEDSPADLVDSLLPASAAMKKRRLAAQKESKPASPVTAEFGEKVSQPVSSGRRQSTLADIFKRKRREEPDKTHILELAQTRREDEEEKARLDAESMKGGLESLDLEQISKLVIVEEEELEVRRRPSARAREPVTGSGLSWDDRWNGRKNFKGFRRKGGSENGAGPRRRVIVEVEESTGAQPDHADYDDSTDYQMSLPSARLPPPVPPSAGPSNGTFSGGVFDPGRPEPDEFSFSGSARARGRKRRVSASTFAAAADWGGGPDGGESMPTVNGSSNNGSGNGKRQRVAGSNSNDSHRYNQNGAEPSQGPTESWSGSGAAVSQRTGSQRTGSQRTRPGGASRFGSVEPSGGGTAEVVAGGMITLDDSDDELQFRFQRARSRR